MAALLYRGKITEAPISEGENDNMLYQQYIHEVRPDMLKLYIALNQPKQKNGKDFITDIKLRQAVTPQYLSTTKIAGWRTG